MTAERKLCPKCNKWIDIDELYEKNDTFMDGIICPKCERWGKCEDWFDDEGG